MQIAAYLRQELSLAILKSTELRTLRHTPLSTSREEETQCHRDELGTIDFL